MQDVQILNEATRNELINKSRSADNYAPSNQGKGKNRYERRLKSSVANSVAQYNKIEMDEFFKRDILQVGIDVRGETNNYVVTMKFSGVLNALQNQVKQNQGKLEFKNVYRALSDTFSTKDIQIHCNCPDAKYRQNYWQWKNNNGTQYEPRPSNITNPHDTKGAGCKHTLLVLSNRDWLMKIASVILNYIKYAQNNLQNAYATYIFPKVYGVPYDRAVQLGLFDNGVLPRDRKTVQDVATVNMADRNKKGQFTQGNKYRFTKKDDKETNEINKDQQVMNLPMGQKKELVPSDIEEN